MRTSAREWKPPVFPPAGIGGHVVVGVRAGVAVAWAREGLGLGPRVEVATAEAEEIAGGEDLGVGCGRPRSGRAKRTERTAMAAIRTISRAPRAIIVVQTDASVPAM
jgi:hypothetical protein